MHPYASMENLRKAGMHARRLQRAALAAHTNHLLTLNPQFDITKALPYSNTLLNGNILEIPYAASHSFDRDPSFTKQSLAVVRNPGRTAPLDQFQYADRSARRWRISFPRTR